MDREVRDSGEAGDWRSLMWPAMAALLWTAAIIAAFNWDRAATTSAELARENTKLREQLAVAQMQSAMNRVAAVQNGLIAMRCVADHPTIQPKLQRPPNGRGPEGVQ